MKRKIRLNENEFRSFIASCVKAVLKESDSADVDNTPKLSYFDDNKQMKQSSLFIKLRYSDRLVERLKKYENGLRAAEYMRNAGIDFDKFDVSSRKYPNPTFPVKLSDIDIRIKKEEGVVLIFFLNDNFASFRRFREYLENDGFGSDFLN